MMLLLLAQIRYITQSKTGEIWRGGGGALSSTNNGAFL